MFSNPSNEKWQSIPAEGGFVWKGRDFRGLAYASWLLSSPVALCRPLSSRQLLKAQKPDFVLQIFLWRSLLKV